MHFENTLLVPAATDSPVLIHVVEVMLKHHQTLVADSLVPVFKHECIGCKGLSMQSQLPSHCVCFVLMDLEGYMLKLAGSISLNQSSHEKNTLCTSFKIDTILSGIKDIQDHLVKWPSGKGGCLDS